MGLGAATAPISDNYAAACGGYDRVVEQRLEELLRVNASIARETSEYRSDLHRVEASLMTNPIDSRKAFAYFGLMIGTLPPFALAFKIAGEAASSDVASIFTALLAAAGIATGTVGYALGRLVPSALAYASRFRQPNRIAFLSLVGLGWGAISGATGGLLLYLIGAIFAGIVGGVIGAIALPVLAIFHGVLKRGDLIEIKHFLPIAFGMTLSLCAFILGF